MTYEFDPLAGATLADLRELVATQSFSLQRYGSLLDTWLNDGVLEVCKRLGIVEGAEILAHDATGLVAQPARPFFRIREAWICDAGANGTDENAVRLAARYKLAPRDQLAASPFALSTLPWGYSARRGAAASGRHVPIEIRVTPAARVGKVGILGLQRPAIMGANGDATGLGADLDDAVVSWAKARAFRQEDDFEMSAAWRAEFEAALTTASTSPLDDGPVITPGIEDC